MAKIARTYKFDEDTIKKIQVLAKEQGLNYTTAIEFAINKYFEERHEDNIALINSIDKLIENKLNEKLNSLRNDLNRVRIATNIIDKHVQMMLEFWNHYFVIHDFKKLGTTEQYKTKELIEAEELIIKRIAYNRQRKLDHESKRKKAE
ncbi:hypothetical protein [Pseudobacillus badius]|uniref:hypothetical protein n=1 Tax=Bacillus badius TaxID=1455 RepID=UPI000597984E|nr:hypothetical protein [Bacillus badius]KIL73865.1 hypothetical protein SD78_2923 [Bacillus badius]UAT32946.1 hypothetical protein K7T73_20095 [Bacillus badius]GLY11965.1 hypothetical protein Bbad01_31810 [Bacillus badius]